MSPIELPLPALETALRTCTRRLADELASPQHSAPDWNEFEWRVAMAVAVMQGVSGLLTTRLRWAGPPWWETFLARQLYQAVLRQQAIESLLAQIDETTARAGVTVVGLKGSALLGLGLYASGERPMADIDLLVHAADTERLLPLLKALGYAEGLRNWRHQTLVQTAAPAQTAFGEHAGNPIKIELHTRIQARLPSSVTDITALAWPAAAPPGLQAYSSLSALMSHLLLHAADNMRSRALRLVQLQDIALLSARMHEDDWQALWADPQRPGPWWALPPLALTEACFAGAVPAAVLHRLEAACPWLLRRAAARQQLADVSFSQLRLEAFPGLEWARSPAEALRFMLSRVFPDDEAHKQRRYDAAAQPCCGGTAWQNLSQAQRIWRWVVSTPPRVHTLDAVQRALAYQP